MLAPGRATYEGTYAHVIDAIHEPKGLQQPRIPITVGGNGPKVTWRLAARFADELNLDALMPASGGGGAAGDRVPLRGDRPRPGHAAGRGARLGRGRRRRARGASASERLKEYADLGLSRVILQGFAAVSDPGDPRLLAEDCAAVGLLERSARPDHRRHSANGYRHPVHEVVAHALGSSNC